MKRRRGMTPPPPLFPSVATLLLVFFASSVIAQSTDAGQSSAEAFTDTTVEVSTVARGDKKIGDKCENSNECGYDGAVCSGDKKMTCQCLPELTATNHIDKCGKIATVNESCTFNEQCEMSNYQTECKEGHCACRFEMTPSTKKDGTIECVAKNQNTGPERYVDPTMIGILVGMALMFIILCVVLRLFSKARWRENRTIFNTPNPRLMNVSLLRDSKLLHGQAGRRGSRASVRGPSRQPSMASLRPQSPQSGGSRRGSNASSNASARSEKKSPTRAATPNNLVPNHTESVTVEVQEPKV